MLLIAHRGLVNGPNPTLENFPDQIRYALKSGYQCEIDLWRVYNQFYLGHDEPQHKIDEEFLYDNATLLWIHTKNLEALEWLMNTNFNYFWHEKDAYTLTSHGIIWAYPKSRLTKMTVCVMPEQFMALEKCSKLDCYAICSDYVDKLSEIV